MHCHSTFCLAALNLISIVLNFQRAELHPNFPTIDQFRIPTTSPNVEYQGKMIKTMSPFTNLCHFVEYKLILKTFIEFYIFLTITGLGLRKRCRYSIGCPMILTLMTLYLSTPLLLTQHPKQTENCSQL